MIGYFPTPYRDGSCPARNESFYSACARYGSFAGYTTATSVNLDLFGSRAPRVVAGIPARLGYFEHALPPGHRYPSARLIDEYTSFPYFAPFLTEERVARARAAMAANRPLAAQVISGSAAVSIRPADVPRYCPPCAREDRRKVKQAYWHRLHQLPGVEVCPAHEVFLEDAELPTPGAGRMHGYVTAQEAIGDPLPRHLSPSDPSHAVLLRLARDAEWLLNQRNLMPGYDTLHRQYMTLLRRKGLATHGGVIKLQKLVDAVEQHYTPTLLLSLQCGIDRSKLSNWPSTIVPGLRKKKYHHPLRHLLLIQFLGVTAEEFFTGDLDDEPFGRGPWPCLNPVCGDYKKPVILACSVSYRSTMCSGSLATRPVGTFECRCGFAYETVCAAQDGKHDDQSRTPRVVTYGHVWDGELRALWADTTFSLVRIGARLFDNPRAEARVKREAHRLGLPFPRKCRSGRLVVTHRRKASKSKAAARPKRRRAVPRDDVLREKYRRRWLAIRKRERDAPRSTLWNRYSSVAKWLAKNDRAWLEEHLPPRRPRGLPHDKLDCELEVLVREAAEVIRDREPPVRVTVFSIGRASGYYDYLRKHLGLLPRTTAVLEAVCESQVQFAARRLASAARLFAAGSMPPSLNKLLEAAKVHGPYRRHPEVLAAADAQLRNIKRGGPVVMPVPRSHRPTRMAAASG